MKEQFTLRYSLTEDGDTCMDVDMTFYNISNDVLIKQINTWLIAIGKSNIKINISNNTNNTNNSNISNISICSNDSVTSEDE
jgi:hypothetical protein